jgi:hypothetical protein
MLTALVTLNEGLLYLARSNPKAESRQSQAYHFCLEGSTDSVDVGSNQASDNEAGSKPSKKSKEGWESRKISQYPNPKGDS